MHELLFGVNDAFVVGEYHFQVMEVSGGTLRIGISSNGDPTKTQEITLSSAPLTHAPADRFGQQESTSRQGL